MAIGPRKFYKINGLNGVFHYNTVGDKEIYDVTTATGFELSFLQANDNYFAQRINEHTILFITACKEDEGRYIQITSKDSDPEDVITYLQKIKQGDTMIWARGDLYSVSTKNVTAIDFDQDTKNFTITYSDGTTTVISQSEMTFSADFPLSITTEEGESKIGLVDLTYDTNHNLILNNSENEITPGVSNSYVAGYGNKSSKNYQHVEGRFAEINGNYIFAIGYGNSDQERLNVFEVRPNGNVIAKRDFIAIIDPLRPIHPEDVRSDHTEYKLSDIHSVLEVDWWFKGDLYADYSEDDYNEDYNI